MTDFLLDVNVLIALSDPMHIHHESAHHWFAKDGRKAWATCPLTENAFVDGRWDGYNYMKSIDSWVHMPRRACIDAAATVPYIHTAPKN